jgi:hypothetical protein
MNMIVSLRNLMLIAALAVLAGCATSRSEVKLGDTDSVNKFAVTKSKVVLIRSVTDERQFEQSPDDPSTPSLGGEGANGASGDIKARAIGRKRGGFGKALGDVLLENGQTVAGVVRENLTAAFKQAGYKTTSSAADAGPSPMIVDVHIKQFWAWVQPGFWAMTLSSHITTDLEISGTAAPAVVSVSEKESRQLVTDSAWIEIVDKALKDYREQASAKAAGLP